MNRNRALIIAAAALWALSCGDGTTDPPPDPPRPTTVTVSPATAELTALDATVQLRAQVLDQYGQVMAGARGELVERRRVGGGGGCLGAGDGGGERGGDDHGHRPRRPNGGAEHQRDGRSSQPSPRGGRYDPRPDHHGRPAGHPRCVLLLQRSRRGHG